MSKKRTAVLIAGRELSLSNLEKPLYPGGFTKGQLIDYYARIAPAMLPHLRSRPVTFKRYPNGVAGASFFEKNCNAYRPSWVKTAQIDYREGHDPVAHCVLSHPADLAWAGNAAAIELHVSLATVRNIGRPKTIVFDLDPGPGTDILDCARISLKLRDLLGRLSLECLAKTSGGKGIHLYIPLNTPATYRQTQPFARSVAELLAKEEPDRITATMKKAERGGKVYVDWAQNMEHKTTACVYSMRAKDRPSVSTPVTFEELERAFAKRDPARLAFGPDEVLKRVEELGDLFEPAIKIKQRLPAAVR